MNLDYGIANAISVPGALKPVGVELSCAVKLFVPGCGSAGQAA